MPKEIDSSRFFVIGESISFLMIYLVLILVLLFHLSLDFRDQRFLLIIKSYAFFCIIFNRV